MFGVKPDKHQRDQTLRPQEQNNCDNQPGHTTATRPHPWQTWGEEDLGFGSGRQVCLPASTQRGRSLARLMQMGETQAVPSPILG